MSEHSNDHVDLLLPGYVLDALDAAERDHVAQHVDVCPWCRRLAESDAATVGQIGFAAPYRRPPPHVKERLMARIAELTGHAPLSPASGTVMVPVPRVASRSSPARAGAGRLPGWLLAAAVLPWLLVAGLGAALVLSPRPAPASHLVVAPLAGPRGEYGRLAMVRAGTDAFLMLTHMPPLPPGTIYVCWLERGGRMERACSFHLLAGTDDATVEFHATHPMATYALLEVTREATARVTSPSGTVLAAGTLR